MDIIPSGVIYHEQLIARQRFDAFRTRHLLPCPYRQPHWRPTVILQSSANPFSLLNSSTEGEY